LKGRLKEQAERAVEGKVEGRGWRDRLKEVR